MQAFLRRWVHKSHKPDREGNESSREAYRSIEGDRRLPRRDYERVLDIIHISRTGRKGEVETRTLVSSSYLDSSAGPTPAVEMKMLRKEAKLDVQ